MAGHEGCQDGIIPADAGSTDPKDVILTLNGDHPRGCGEHWEGIIVFMQTTGSSPRMRGAPRYRSWVSW